MNRELETLVLESSVHSVPYSKLRRGNIKWESNPLKPKAILQKIKAPGKKEILIIRDQQGRSGLVIQKRRGLNRYFYLQDFLDRIQLKRNPAIVRSLYALWAAINPNHVKQLPKKIMKQVTHTAAGLVRKVVNPAWVQKDLKIDFKQKTGIVFSQFYDSIFQLIDNSIPGKDCQAYLAFIFDIQQKVLNSEWVKKYAPEFRIERDSQPCYHAWMLPYFTQQRNRSTSLNH